MTSGGVEGIIKGVATAAVSVAAVSPFDLWWLIVLAFGLVAGSLARVARLVDAEEAWPRIKRDLYASTLAGGANGLLAAFIIYATGLDFLQGAGVAAICAFSGTHTLETAARWLLRKIIEDGRKGDT